MFRVHRVRDIIDSILKVFVASAHLQMVELCLDFTSYLMLMHRLRYLYLPSFRNKVTSTFNQFSLVLFQTADRAVNNTKLWKLRNRET